MAVFDTPPADTGATKEDEFAHLSEKERKAKLKKLKQKEEKEKERKALEDEKNAAAAKAGGKGAGAEKKVDPDPEGKTLVSGDVLAEATKLLNTLHKYEPKNIETNLLAFKVHLRRSIKCLRYYS